MRGSFRDVLLSFCAAILAGAPAWSSEDEGLGASLESWEGVPAALVRSPGMSGLDLSLHFSLRSLPEADAPFLPALPSLFSRAAPVRVSYGGNPRTGRLELVLSVTSSDAEPRGTFAALAAALSGETGARANPEEAREALREEAGALRARLEGGAPLWGLETAEAYARAADPAWLGVHCPWTRLHHLERVYFRLLGYPDGHIRHVVEEVLEDIGRSSEKAERVQLVSRFEQLAQGVRLPPAHPGTLRLKAFGAYFRDELKRLPEDSWRADLKRLVAETQADLAFGPQEEFKRLGSLLSAVLSRRGLRVALAGRPEDVERSQEGARALPRALPDGGAPARAAAASGGSAPVLARLRERLGELKSLPSRVGFIDGASAEGVWVRSMPFASHAARAPHIELLAAALAAARLRQAAPALLELSSACAGGLEASLAEGRLRAWASGCPDLPGAADRLAAAARGQGPSLDEAAARALSWEEGGADAASRARLAVERLADGIGEEQTLALRRAVGEAARTAKPAAIEVRASALLEPLLPGYARKPVKAAGMDFTAGPEAALAAWEARLKELGRGEEFVRIYPRDFWF